MSAISEDDFRAIMSRLVSGVSVVTARAGTLDLAMTATSLVSVSLEPPTLLFAVHQDSRLAEALEDGSRWAANILGPDAIAAADWLASPGRPTRGQLDRIPHTHGELSGAAVLTDAAAWAECETTWVKPAASHLVVVGRVLGGGLRPHVRGAIVHAHGRMEKFGANGEM